MKFKHPYVASSILRTGLYGTITAVFTLTDAEAIMVVDAIVVGIVVGDYSTWFFKTICLAPLNAYLGVYDGVINMLFAAYFFNHMPVMTDFEPSAAAISFFMTLVMVALKSLWYTIEYTRRF